MGAKPINIDNVELREDYVPLTYVLSELDKQIGRLLEGLEDMGVSDNTIIVFTSDNGPNPSFGQCRTLGMRGWKNSLYEGGIKLPFMVRYPDKIEGGKIDDSSVICSVDLYHTLCAMAGVEIENGVKFDGEDVSKAIFTGEGVDREKAIYWDFGRNEYFRHPDIDYHVSPHLAIRKGDWKLLVNSDNTDVELYNLKTDPYETINLSEKETERVKNLKTEVLDWYETRPEATWSYGNADTHEPSRRVDGIEPLFDHWLRDTYAMLGPDDYYYVTGTTATEGREFPKNIHCWDWNDGIYLWRSKDLRGVVNSGF